MRQKHPAMEREGASLERDKGRKEGEQLQNCKLPRFFPKNKNRSTISVPLVCRYQSSKKNTSMRPIPQPMLLVGFQFLCSGRV